MARNYTALSGADMVKKIRSQNIISAIGCVLVILISVGMLIGGVLLLRTGNSMFYGIASLVIGVVLFWCMGRILSKSLAVLKNVAESRLFRKYGTPDELAQQISEGSVQRILESNQALVTDSFIMKHSDFESFVPFQSILLLYRKEHRTNGILDGIYLVVHDAYGDSFEYPFKLGKKHAEDMNVVANIIAQRAPNCRIGYTQENLNYVKQNAKQI